MDQHMDNPILTPMRKTGKAFYVAIIIIAVFIAGLLFAWYTQLTQGLSVTGMGDLGVMAGAPWGAYIGTFIWWVGIAHGGIAISAGIRLMKVEKYKPIARMAEVITPITLALAGFAIFLDLGRPDRVFNLILNFPERVGTSPMVWDMIVILVYLATSVTYLLITMRADMAELKIKSKIMSPIYKLALIGYDPAEKPKMEKMAWWMALSLLVLMALLSGGVIPWLFGLLPSRPGWYGAALGPYFLIAALASAMAAVIVVAMVARRTFKWYNIISDDIFRGLGKIMSFFILLYLWFMLHEVITMQFATGGTEKLVSDALLYGEFAPLYWLVVIGLIVSFIFFAVQTMRPTSFSPKGTFGFSIFILLIFWVKRYLIIVPSLYYNPLPYPVGSYSPTWVEATLIIGTVAIAALGIMLFFKFFPGIDLEFGKGKLAIDDMPQSASIEEVEEEQIIEETEVLVKEEIPPHPPIGQEEATPSETFENNVVEDSIEMKEVE